MTPDTTDVASDDRRERGLKRSASETDSKHSDDEGKKLQLRREANRMHAFKSRQRSKTLMSELQHAVEKLGQEKVELERQNAVLRAQVDVLQQQNMTLLQNQQQIALQNQQQPKQQAPASQTQSVEYTTAAAPPSFSQAPAPPPTAANTITWNPLQQHLPGLAMNPFMSGLSQLAATNPSLMMAAAAAGMMGAATNPGFFFPGLPIPNLNPAQPTDLGSAPQTQNTANTSQPQQQPPQNDPERNTQLTGEMRSTTGDGGPAQLTISAYGSDRDT